MSELHLLRPLWLVLLPVGAWLIWQLLRGRADAGGWRSTTHGAPLLVVVTASSTSFHRAASTPTPRTHWTR